MQPESHSINTPPERFTIYGETHLGHTQLLDRLFSSCDAGGGNNGDSLSDVVLEIAPVRLSRSVLLDRTPVIISIDQHSSRSVESSERVRSQDWDELARIRSDGRGEGARGLTRVESGSRASPSSSWIESSSCSVQNRFRVGLRLFRSNELVSTVAALHKSVNYFSASDGRSKEVIHKRLRKFSQQCYKKCIAMHSPQP